MKKRLIVCCDGTWNWPDQKGNPTNVVKLTHAILRRAGAAFDKLVDRT